MKSLVGSLMGVGLLATLAGCGAAAAVVGAATGTGGSLMTVELVNTSPDFNVEVTLFFHADDEVIESVLTSELLDSQMREFIIPAGQTTSLLAQDCDNLQAIIIESADLRLFGGIGPSDNTDVLRGDGDDFDCGDRLVFTFSHADVAIPTDLNISFDVR